VRRLKSNEQIIVPAQINYLPVLRNFICRIASKYKFSKGEVNALTISVDEACTNIIKHGYRDIPSGSITMKVNIKTDRLVVELIDHGISFDPNQVSDPNLDQYIQNGKKGGLGIFIMKKFLDEIQYATSETANILRLVKFRRAGLIHPILYPINSALRRLKDILFPARHKLIHNNGEA
jgi:anti-sigma regulatory factor (Ser/Thr protein kinase)